MPLSNRFPSKEEKRVKMLSIPQMTFRMWLNHENLWVREKSTRIGILRDE